MDYLAMAKVLLLYNAPLLPVDHPDAESERDLLLTVESVHQVLHQYSHQVNTLGLTDSPEQLLNTVRTTQPDVVFNLFEGFGTRPASEYHVAGLLNWLNVPYTGCPVEAMVLGRDKVRTKQLLRGAGLPTAEFIVVNNITNLQLPESWPVIVKPAGTDASIGIDQGSVVSDEASLRKQVASVLQRYGSPVLVETYLPGPEFNIGVIESPEMLALPIAEMVYTPQPGVQWPIVSYASKWETGSVEDLAMQPRCPAQISEGLRDRLQSIALAAFQLIGCKDVARIDCRLDAAGVPNILEVNPNPDLGSTAGLARMLRTANFPYGQFIDQLVRNHVAP
jgi:D-alanine-D-alanine ligase